MNELTLNVEGTLPGELTFVLQRPEGKSVTVKGETDLTIEALEADPASLAKVVPPKLVRELGQWIVDNPSAAIIAVESANTEVEAIPWEYLPQWLRLANVFVVRQVTRKPGAAAPDPKAELRMLAAGWSGRPLFKLPGIEAELAALSLLGKAERIQVQVLFEPDTAELARACTSLRPDILHLIPAGVDTQQAVAELALSRDGKVDFVPADQFVAELPSDLRPSLVVLNTCDGSLGGGGPSAIRIIAERLHTVVAGWAGKIDDRAAVDFARFLYARIFDGETIVDAMRAYTSIQAASPSFAQPSRGMKPPIDRRRSFSSVPAVWTPSIPHLTRPLFEQTVLPKQATTARTRGDSTPRSAAPTAAAVEASQPELKIELKSQKWLNPALLRNGRAVLTNLSITVDRPLRNAVLSVTCDTGSGTSTVRETLDMQKGPQPVATDEWQFPVLYELIKAAVPRRQINFTVSCSYSGNILAEITQPILWMGCTEWLDKPETWRFLPAFVDPYCEGVLDVIDSAYKVLMQLVSPSSTFNDYQSGDPEFVRQQVKAVFNSLREDPFVLRYMPPPAILVYEQANDEYASGQRIRTPDQVIQRRRGTCNDLAVLFASCLEHIQVYPLIVLISGHTFFGFWRDKQAYGDFWSTADKDRRRRPSDPGRAWTITDTGEIQELLNAGAISLVDAVTVTNRNATFEDAEGCGFRYFTETTGATPTRAFDVAVDICASRRAVQPL